MNVRKFRNFNGLRLRFMIRKPRAGFKVYIVD